MTALRRDATAGVILILLGGFFLLRHRVPLSGPGAVLLIIGAAFFAISAMRGFRGPLLPAGVCLGLGAGFLVRGTLAPWFPQWGSLLLGLAAGFLLVAAIDATQHRDRGPGPLVAGVILLLVSLFSAAERVVDLSAAARALSIAWPWMLVAAGILLVATSLRRRPGSR